MTPDERARLDAHCRKRCASRLKQWGMEPKELRCYCPSPVECRLEVGIRSRRRRGGKHELTTTPDRPKTPCPF